MTNANELIALITKARRAGVTVLCTYDADALELEGREIIETVTVIGLKGCGSFPMPAITAAERLRTAL